MKRVATIVVGIVLSMAGRASGAESLGVIAVGDAPGGPDPDLAELTHQLRAACRDRVGGVEDVPGMRARLLGQGSNATVSELDRAYGGALAVYQNGEFESAVRTLRAIVDDLEALPEGDEAYHQWTRALLRLAHAAATIGRDQEADAALVQLLRTEPTLQADADQYSPSYRRHLDELRARVRGLPRRRLSVVAQGRAGTVFVNGRAMGTTPLTLTLAAGTYRIGGAAGSLRVPSFSVELEGEDRSVVLDFGLAEALRANAGPGLALSAGPRADGIIRAGAWLGVDKLVVASRAAEGEAQFLLGSIYDVRRGALLREGSVRMVAGTVPSVNLGALASFLLTGQSSREVKERTPELPRELAAPPAARLRVATPLPPGLDAAVSTVSVAPAATTSSPERVAAASEPGPAKQLAVAPGPAPVPEAAAKRDGVGDARGTALLALPAAGDDALPLAPASTGTRPPRAGSGPRWIRPAAIAAGIAAAGLGGMALQQQLSASRSYADARAMLGPDGNLLPGSDPARYWDVRHRADSAARGAYLSAGSAILFAAAAGVLGWMSWDAGAPGPTARF